MKEENSFGFIHKDDTAMIEWVRRFKERGQVEDESQPYNFSKLIRKRNIQKNLESALAGFSLKYTVVIERNGDEAYRAYCPGFRNVSVRAKSKEEALAKIDDRLKSYVQRHLAMGKPAPTQDVSVETVQVP